VQTERFDPAIDTAPVRACHEINTELCFEVLERQLSWELETARAPRPAGLAAPGAGAAQS
jgi:hypothetical protein